GLDFEKIGKTGLARVIPSTAKSLPDWARYRGRTWTETGHRLIVRAWDHDGRLRSVRAWRVTDGDSPKRLPPAGKRAAGLVLANRTAVLMLRRLACPLTLVIVEGEPDWISWSIQTPNDA